MVQEIYGSNTCLEDMDIMTVLLDGATRKSLCLPYDETVMGRFLASRGSCPSKDLVYGEQVPFLNMGRVRDSLNCLAEYVSIDETNNTMSVDPTLVELSEQVGEQIPRLIYLKLRRNGNEMGKILRATSFYSPSRNE